LIRLFFFAISTRVKGRWGKKAVKTNENKEGKEREIEKRKKQKKSFRPGKHQTMENQYKSEERVGPIGRSKADLIAIVKLNIHRRAERV